MSRRTLNRPPRKSPPRSPNTSKKPPQHPISDYHETPIKRSTLPVKQPFYGFVNDTEQHVSRPNCAIRRATCAQSSGVMPKCGRFFLGPNHTAVPKPTEEANRCILRHLAPKTLQKALYVGFFESVRPLQVVCFGWSQFPFPEAGRADQSTWMPQLNSEDTKTRRLKTRRRLPFHPSRKPTPG